MRLPDKVYLSWQLPFILKWFQWNHLAFIKCADEGRVATKTVVATDHWNVLNGGIGCLSTKNLSLAWNGFLLWSPYLCIP